LSEEYVAELGENEYIASDPEVGKKRKHVTYFLAEAPFVELELEKKGGLDDTQWFKLTDVLDLNFYEDILPTITKALNHLASIKTGDKGTKKKASKK